jgi:hypothetical protein
MGRHARTAGVIDIAISDPFNVCLSHGGKRETNWLNIMGHTSTAYKDRPLVEPTDGRASWLFWLGTVRPKLNAATGVRSMTGLAARWPVSAI